MFARIEDNRILFRDDLVDAQTRRHIRNNLLDPTYFDKKLSVFACQPNIDALEQMGFMVVGELDDLYKPHDISWKNNRAVKKKPVNGLKWRSHQRNALRFYEHNEGKCFLAFEAGGGKTAASICIALHKFMRKNKKQENYYTGIFITPATIKKQWKGELKSWGNIDAEVLYGTKPYKLKSHTNYIINWELLQYWLPELVDRFDYMVADEWQNSGEMEQTSKNRMKSQRGKQIITLLKTIPNLILLSATPYRSHVRQLFPIFNFFYPGLYKNVFAFEDHFCYVKQGKYGREVGDVKYPAELNHMLSKFMYFVKTEDVVDIPPKQYIPVMFEVSDSALKKYDNQLQEISRTKLKAKVFDKEAVLDYLAENKNTKAVEALSQSAFAMKKKDVIKWIDDFLAVNDKLVVGCKYKAIIRYIQEHYGDKAVFYQGGMTEKKKEEALRKFQEEVPLAIVQQETTTGLDGLQHVCSNVCIVDICNAQITNQFVNRIYRTGQEHKTNFYFLMAEGTLDEKHVDKLQKGQDTFNKVIEGGKGVKDIFETQVKQDLPWRDE